MHWASQNTENGFVGFKMKGTRNHAVGLFFHVYYKEMDLKTASASKPSSHCRPATLLAQLIRKAPLSWDYAISLQGYYTRFLKMYPLIFLPYLQNYLWILLCLVVCSFIAYCNRAIEEPTVLFCSFNILYFQAVWKMTATCLGSPYRVQLHVCCSSCMDPRALIGEPSGTQLR